MGKDELRSRRYRDVGGTSGGLGEFLLGIVFLVVGGYMLLNHVIVTSGGAFFGRRFAVGFAFPGAGGFSPFGTALLATFIGVAILFFRGRSIAGWALVVLGVAAIFLGIIADLHVYFAPATLLVTLVMFGLIAAGVGLVFRALLPHGDG